MIQGRESLPDDFSVTRAEPNLAEEAPSVSLGCRDVWCGRESW